MSLSGKIRDLRDLISIAEAERARGGRVVLAHGTFDLLHIGHLRYLRRARALGSLLIVTLTADTYVNRGPGRPVFPEDMRAEMLAGLDCVDHVAVVHASLAVPAIEAVKPSVYAKGAEYREADKDITGGITLEAGAVKANGGELVFIDDITFSSTSLINRHLGVHDPQLQRYLEGVAGRGTLNRLADFAEQIADTRVVILGDAILDEYIYVSPLGKSAKENIIATLHQSSELFAGGVFAAANHLAGLCREVDLITVVGAECPHMAHAREKLKDNVTLHAIERPGTPTTRKTRFIDESYMRKLFEVYHMDDRPVSTTSRPGSTPSSRSGWMAPTF